MKNNKSIKCHVIHLLDFIKKAFSFVKTEPITKSKMSKLERFKEKYGYTVRNVQCITLTSFNTWYNSGILSEGVTEVKAEDKKLRRSIEHKVAKYFQKFSISHKLSNIDSSEIPINQLIQLEKWIECGNKIDISSGFARAINSCGNTIYLNYKDTELTRLMVFDQLSKLEVRRITTKNQITIEEILFNFSYVTIEELAKISNNLKNKQIIDIAISTGKVIIRNLDQFFISEIYETKPKHLITIVRNIVKNQTNSVRKHQIQSIESYLKLLIDHFISCSYPIARVIDYIRKKNQKEILLIMIKYTHCYKILESSPKFKNIIDFLISDKKLQAKTLNPYYGLIGKNLSKVNDTTWINTVDTLYKDYPVQFFQHFLWLYNIKRKDPLSFLPVLEKIATEDIGKAKHKNRILSNLIKICNILQFKDCKPLKICTSYNFKPSSEEQVAEFEKELKLYVKCCLVELGTSLLDGIKYPIHIDVDEFLKKVPVGLYESVTNLNYKNIKVLEYIPIRKFYKDIKGCSIYRAINLDNERWEFIIGESNFKYTFDNKGNSVIKAEKLGDYIEMIYRFILSAHCKKRNCTIYFGEKHLLSKYIDPNYSAKKESDGTYYSSYKGAMVYVKFIEFFKETFLSDKSMIEFSMYEILTKIIQTHNERYTDISKIRTLQNINYQNGLSGILKQLNNNFNDYDL